MNSQNYEPDRIFICFDVCVDRNVLGFSMEITLSSINMWSGSRGISGRKEAVKEKKAHWLLTLRCFCIKENVQKKKIYIFNFKIFWSMLVAHLCLWLLESTLHIRTGQHTLRQ